MTTGLLASFVTSLALASGIPGGSIREVAKSDLADAAATEMTADGPIILYNPTLFEAAGDARGFVVAHEYGHVLLGHLTNHWMLTSDEGHRMAEAEADCFAAQRASTDAVIAMVRLLARRGPEARDAIYGTKTVRALRILSCASADRREP